jgi:hypothetical protein
MRALYTRSVQVGAPVAEEARGSEPQVLDLVKQGFLLDGVESEPPQGTICMSPPVEHGPSGIFSDGFEAEPRFADYVFRPYRRGTSPHPLDCGT